MRNWNVVITPLGDTQPLYEGTVTAAHWMAALGEARRAAGHTAGLPPGASCQIATDGSVLVLDARARQRMELTPGETSVAAAAPTPPAATPTPPAAEPPPGTPNELELILRRDEDPAPQNPLVYRERSYLVAPGTSLEQAEQRLRHALAALQEELGLGQPRGVFIHLAVFDHRWQGRPQRGPLVTLQWKDWRGDIQVSRADAATPSSPPG